MARLLDKRFAGILDARPAALAIQLVLLLLVRTTVDGAARIHHHHDPDDVDAGDLQGFHDNHIRPDVDAKAGKSELLLVHVLFRHGNRTPDEPPYPNDPYANETYYPMGWGRLTPAGKRTEYHLGSFLRARYNQFLGPRYSPHLMSARSTDFARTKDSIALVLAALFPPTNQDAWDTGLGPKWNTISVESTPTAEDKLLYMWDAPCPAYDRAFNEALNSRELQAAFHGKNAQVLNLLERYTGAPMNQPEDVYNIYQALLAQRDLDMKLPSWTKEVFPDKMKPATIMFFELDTWTRKMQRLRAGPLLKRILHQSVARSRSDLKPPERKLYLYSAHDNNVSAFMRALNVWESVVLPYGTAVIVEVRRLKGQVGIELYLRNSSEANNEVWPLKMSDCEQFCPLEKFVKLTADVIPNNWDEECNSTKS